MPENKIDLNLLNTPSKEKWAMIGTKRRSGVAVPLFSLYSQKSLGIGDFEDLRLLIDWSSLTGNSIIQLLPLNEVGSNFCPYDSLSSFALDPMYLSLRVMVKGKEKFFAQRLKDISKKFPLKIRRVDYRIKEEKIKVLWDIYLCEEGQGLQDFTAFKNNNIYWLRDFALFKVLKNYHQGLPWYEWEEKYRLYSSFELEHFYQQHLKEIDFQMWLQWQIYRQLSLIKEYAKVAGVLLKGDLPFLVSRDSADVWAHQEFFKLDFAAGAPADMYCAKGQRWGMPTHNWEAIAHTGYGYLKERLKYAQNFYDILRIDHVVGLFRIWSIPFNEPQENQGLHGFFDPRDEKFWESHGKNLLSVMLKNSNMLLCAEDLGMIPPSCTKTLESLGIPGNEVQRWVKDWKLKHDFLKPSQYRLAAVAMLSTHDTINWPAWWENEAGTVDEELFIRKCLQYGIDYPRIKPQLFNLQFSRHKRLRWLDGIDSLEVLLSTLGKKKEEVADIVNLYLDTFREKEKLWLQFGLKGPMRESFDVQILSEAFKMTLASRSIFCIHSLIDWLCLSGVSLSDSYPLRINTPGTVGEDNWSLRMPLSLEELLRYKVNGRIRDMIRSSDRI